MKNKKRVNIILGIFLAIILIVAYNQLSTTGKSIITQQIEGVPLSQEQQQKVVTTLTSSKFIKDVPKKNPISLRFFDFQNGQRRWRDGFLIGKNQLLTQGKPTVYLTLDSKYISEFNQDNICEIIKKAKQNGDLGFHSKSNKASLLWKYKSMLKHRGCFGF